MLTRVIPVDLVPRGDGLFVLSDESLREPIQGFCEKFLKCQHPALPDYKRVWVSFQGEHITGIAGVRFAPDMPLLRSITPEALRALAQRANDYFADLGYRGHEGLIYVGEESPQGQCPGRDDSMKAFDLKPSRRWSTMVR